MLSVSLELRSVAVQDKQEEEDGSELQTTGPIPRRNLQTATRSKPQRLRVHHVCRPSSRQRSLIAFVRMADYMLGSTLHSCSSIPATSSCRTWSSACVRSASGPRHCWKAHTANPRFCLQPAKRRRTLHLQAVRFPLIGMLTKVHSWALCVALLAHWRDRAVSGRQGPGCCTDRYCILTRCC
jgi:hypothetical protein